MTIRLNRRAFGGLACGAFFGLISSSRAEQKQAVHGASYSRSVVASFDDVFADLEFAITERNYRITGINSIGRAIAERHEDDADFPRAAVIHFCNIEAAREILKISMDFLLLMPCRITLNEQGSQVKIEAQLLPYNDPRLRLTARNVNAMLMEIVDFAAGDW